MAKIIKTEIPDDKMHTLVGRNRYTIEFECTRCHKTKETVIWGNQKFAEGWTGICDPCEEKVG